MCHLWAKKDNDKEYILLYKILYVHVQKYKSIILRIEAGSDKPFEKKSDWS